MKVLTVVPVIRAVNVELASLLACADPAYLASNDGGRDTVRHECSSMQACFFTPLADDCNLARYAVQSAKGASISETP